ncbi:hypothetical protein IAG44_05395 [Streptomyces roseirectus]|uniref:Uncharacterized protein n=1 Tax=Streptomyces roseirectus TaxID=2768066 RepID=A0A7H0I822_9ACTN|nr:DUF6214 family protein [Streptomyces roseirectus]QNP68938.1 hypothetical protein IAG44_05395 [Streptomyces roseirectus]
MLETSFLNLSDRRAEDAEVAVRPAWEVRESGAATAWYTVRLAFPDRARVEVLAVVGAGGVCIEDVKAEPPLSLIDLTVLADWIEGPLFEVCGGRQGEEGSRRSRPSWPGGTEGARLVAQEYRAAQEAGGDPVLAVMAATGHSRRRSLMLIAQARDAGLLTARHSRG